MDFRPSKVQQAISLSCGTSTKHNSDNHRHWSTSHSLPEIPDGSHVVSTAMVSPAMTENRGNEIARWLWWNCGLKDMLSLCKDMDILNG